MLLKVEGGSGCVEPVVHSRSKAPGSRVALAGSVTAAVVSAVALIVATDRYGIGLTPDSVDYLLGARHLAEGGGYTVSNKPVTVFAPGYSALLSVGDRFGLDPLQGARVLSVAALCGTIALSYVLLRRHVYSQKVVLAGTLAVALSSVLLEVHREAMSEHLFIPTVLLFVLAGEEHVRSRRALWPLAALIVLSWVAFYLRYAGIVFIGIAGVLVLVTGWRRSARSALARSAVVIVAASFVPALWMKRNIDLGVPPLGPRHDAAASFGTNASRAVDEFERWLTSDWVTPALRPFVYVAAVAMAVGAIVLLVRARINVRDEAREMFPLTLVVGLYIVYLVITASVFAFAAIDFRFLSPVFVPSIILAAWVADRAYRVARPATRALIIGVGLAWLAVAAVAFRREVSHSYHSGAGGYAIERWQHSSLIRDVERLDPTVLTLSNDPLGIEFFTGRVVNQSPSKTYFASSESVGSLDSFVHTIECRRRAKLVWFVPNSRTYLYSVDELRQRVKLTPISTQHDGVIYDVEPKAGDGKQSCPTR